MHVNVRFHYTWSWHNVVVVFQLCPTLCNSMDGSSPVFPVLLPVLHQLPWSAHTHIHSVDNGSVFHDAISSSVVPFSSCLQSFPASGSFQMSQFFASGGQSIGASASAPVLTGYSQDWFPLGFTGAIALQSKGLSSVFSNTTVQKH